MVKRARILLVDKREMREKKLDFTRLFLSLDIVHMRGRFL